MVTTEATEIEESTDYEKDWEGTKAAFNRALRSPGNFNAFHWVVRLLRAAFSYYYYTSGLAKLGLHKQSKSLIPCFAFLLISLVIFCYFKRLRNDIIGRWCRPHDTKDVEHLERCYWSFFHDFFVSYIGVMILFNYVAACFRSPGVALDARYNALGVTDNVLSEELKWKAINCQGGCFMMNPSLDIKSERRRIKEWIVKQEVTRESSPEVFPNNEWSFCKKCNIQRPPRTHHCSKCKRCIVRYDHHCVWVNNCIGYHNYRQFLLLLFYLSLGCLYGIAVLYDPFYMPLKKQVAEHGFQFLYSNNTGFLNIPPVWTLVKCIYHNTLENEVIIKLIFPLLFFVGVILTIFFCCHVMYVLSGVTTLEHKILMEMSRTKTSSKKSDNGWYQNLRVVLGPNMFLVFLPITVNPYLDLDVKTALKKD